MSSTICQDLFKIFYYQFSPAIYAVDFYYIIVSEACQQQFYFSAFPHIGRLGLRPKIWKYLKWILPFYW